MLKRDRFQAILLLGPTGVGKTPLGELCQRKGLAGVACRHFDFGAALRSIAATPGEVDYLQKDDLTVIRHSLERGTLLENRHFHIAADILKAFCARNEMGCGDWLVLNGLPRHVDQARDMDRLVRVRRIVVLQSPATVIATRIGLNTGGDREGRQDDDPAAIENKLEIYTRRTLPLIAHYRGRGARVIHLDVAAATRAEELHARLEPEQG